MKTPFFILSLILFSFIAHPQKTIKDTSFNIQEAILLDSTYNYRKGNDGSEILDVKRSHKYDSLGYVAETLITATFNNNVSVEIIRFQNDIYGNVLTKNSDYYYRDVWGFSEKTENTINSENLVIESIDYYNENKNNPVWIKEKKSIYDYNIEGKLKGAVQYVWNDEINNWEENCYEQYFYNDKNLIISYRYNIWDGDSEQFVFYRKSRYYYDEENKCVKIEGLVWDFEIREWISHSISENTYENDLVAYEIYSYYNTDSLKWFPLRKHSYFYDTNNMAIIDSSFFYSNYYERWDYKGRYNRYYSVHEIKVMVIASMVDLNVSELVVFPNPTTGTIELNNSELYNFNLINIYDYSGKLIEQQPFKNKISLKNVSRGNYILEFVGPKEKKHAKIVKE